MNKDWLDIGVLEDYLDGKLDAKTMNRVEREALEDPFVAEALAGLSESPKRSLQSISLLQKQLHERIAQHQTVKKTSVITWQRLSIGAAAAVMFIAVSIMFWMRENNHQKELAGQPKKIDVNIAPEPGVPESTATVVQAAPVVASTAADQVKEKEIDRAIKEAKTNTYAARVKTKSSVAEAPVQPAAAPQQLNEIVVAGYGAERKRDITGAVSTISADSLAQSSYSAFSKKEVRIDSDRVKAALKGKVAGIQIRGMSTVTKNAAKLVSNPVGGWDKLFEYIKTNNAFANEPKSGQQVELSFKVDRKGNPSDIQIVKGADHKYEQEAIRLVLNGPKWERPEQSGSRMFFTIDF